MARITKLQTLKRNNQARNAQFTKKMKKMENNNRHNNLNFAYYSVSTVSPKLQENTNLLLLHQT